MKATDSDSGIKEASAAADVKGQMELRVKVAELLGVKLTDGEVTYFDKYGVRRLYGDKQSLIPDYPNDLNACHAFEESLNNNDAFRYSLNLADIVDAYVTATPNCPLIKSDDIHATAEQRCRAFVKTMKAPSVPNGNDSSSASSSPKSTTAVTPTKGTN